MIKVKICGITNLEDAKWAASFGASFIGLNFVKESVRRLTEDKAQEIVKSLPGFVTPVGVFADAEEKQILKMAKHTEVKIVQLHGDETPELCNALKSAGLKVIKAIRIRDDSSMNHLPSFIGCVDYFLLDAYSEESLGGTGETFPWEMAGRAKEYEIPIFLAGGLTVENVRKAVKEVRPFAVDTASGVERSPRRKDPDKMRAFIQQARSV